MTHDSLTYTINLSILFGIVFGIMLIAYEDNVPFALFKKLRCKTGFHKRSVLRSKKYYCQFCKKPRKHPQLKVIDGNNKLRDNDYKF